MSFKPGNNTQKKDLNSKLLDNENNQENNNNIINQTDNAKQIEVLQHKYLDFIKIFEEIKDYEVKLSEFKRKDYEKVKDY